MMLVSLILFFVSALGVCAGLQGKEFGNPALRYELGREHGLKEERVARLCVFPIE